MGTRADFYVGRGRDSEWLGSIAWDGYPSGIPRAVLDAKTESEFRESLKRLMSTRDDWTEPDRDGWPWPWENSRLTDYVYAFDGDAVFGSSCGGWFVASDPEPEEDESGTQARPEFPVRGGKTQGAIFGPRSGIMVFGLK